MTARSILKYSSFRLFLLLDRIGVHVLPKHFYTPIPDYAWLRSREPVWTGRAPLTGVQWDLDAQVAWLAEVCRPYYQEVAGLHFLSTQSKMGPGYGPIEAQVLHCVVRALTPARIVEVGSGQSTTVMAQARQLNRREGKPNSVITCIEPYPNASLRQLADITIIENPVQAAPLSAFDQLESGDLLFIDCSHAVKLGSDVVHLYLSVIPELPAGITIHIHDINLPFPYPRTALLDYFGWMETAFLLALLTNNEKLKVLACLSALHYDCPNELSAVLTDYRPQANRHGLMPHRRAPGHFPASTWLRTG